MRRTILLVLLGALAIAVAMVYFLPSSPRPSQPTSDSTPVTPRAKAVTLRLGGGPPGDTFNAVSRAMARLLPSMVRHFKVQAVVSKGSLDNLRRLEAGELDLGLVYAGDLWQGSRGELLGDHRRYQRVRSVGFLYGAAALLVVPSASPVRKPAELADKRVAVGARDSGAALAAERFFRHLRLWGLIQPRFQCCTPTVRAQGPGEVEALWVLGGLGDASLERTARQKSIRLLNLAQAAEKSGFYKTYPFYSPVVIPAGSYPGQERPCHTFQDSALLCTRQGMDPVVIYDVLRSLWSAEGLKTLREAAPVLKDMSLVQGFVGAPVPLARGAVRFWQERGKNVPDSLRPGD